MQRRAAWLDQNAHAPGTVHAESEVAGVFSSRSCARTLFRQSGRSETHGGAFRICDRHRRQTWFFNACPSAPPVLPPLMA